MTQQLRDELIATARRMSELGLAPGTTGNVSVRTARGFVVTPSGMAYDQLRGDDAVAIDLDGTIRPGQRAPSSEWRLHRDILSARPDIDFLLELHAVAHFHELVRVAGVAVAASELAAAVGIDRVGKEFAIALTDIKASMTFRRSSLKSS